MDASRSRARLHTAIPRLLHCCRPSWSCCGSSSCRCCGRNGDYIACASIAISFSVYVLSARPILQCGLRRSKAVMRLAILMVRVLLGEGCRRSWRWSPLLSRYWSCRIREARVGAATGLTTVVCRVYVRLCAIFPTYDSSIFTLLALLVLILVFGVKWIGHAPFGLLFFVCRRLHWLGRVGCW